MLYGITIDDIDRGKRRQWVLTYYIIATYGAIIAFYSYTHNNLYESQIAYFKWFLLCTAFLLNLLGIFHLADIHCCIYEYRRRLMELKKQFSLKTQRVIEITNKSWSRYISYGYYFWSFTLILSVMLCVGFVFVIFVIMHSEPGFLKTVVSSMFLNLLALCFLQRFIRT